MAGVLRRLRLLDRDIGTSEAEFACGRMFVWRGCDKVFVVGKAGAWNTQPMDTALGVSSSSMVTVCD